MKLAPLKRKLTGLRRKLRQARMIAKAMQSRCHPIVAHIIPIRRCNLSCAYCNEYDSFSQPVSTAEMLRRIDMLACLGTTLVTISGGEPLLHPELDEIIRHIRKHGMIATVITNGYLLTPRRIRGLNRAGLEHMEISIDNVVPDEVSNKSLKMLDRKLQWLAEHAEFDVNINSVLGSGIRHPEDAVTIARRALELGFQATIGITHDQHGQLVPLNKQQQRVYEDVAKIAAKSFWNYAYYNQFQKNLIRGVPNDWHCHAGSRYLYICEDGLVHYCSQQRGFPGIPLEKYTQEHIEHEFDTVKPCAPYCTISCVHQVSMIDLVREKPVEVLQRFFPPPQPNAPCSLPLGVKLLTSVFPPETRGVPKGTMMRMLAGATMKILGIR